MQILGLYLHNRASSYEGDSYSSERLLATDNTEKQLRQRWNVKQKEQCLEYGYQHKSYHRHINPPFLAGTELKFSGNTGGGYASVSNTLTIKPVPQWDTVG